MDLAERILGGERLDLEAALALERSSPAAALVRAAGLIRDAGHRNIVSYSKKVFIPLTHLCRDVCHYCTYATTPSKLARAYMTPEEVLDVAKAGATAGCKEALFTLGDKPELRYRAAREALASFGHESTVGYLAEVAKRVLEETGLLPHMNPGVLSAAEIERLRRVSVSQGLMLESAADRLSEKGGPHYGSPDKVPARRIETIAAAGEQRVPFTSGILIGIGETRAERIESLLVLRDLAERYGHLQEVIIQNFRAKPGTKMARAPEPDLAELEWTIAMARLVLGPRMNIQAPPNLSPGGLARLIAAGINDWGGVSPVTPDFVNPEAPWPNLEALARETARCGKVLTERLAVYPEYARDHERWVDAALWPALLRGTDSTGFAHVDAWSAGSDRAPAPAAEPRNEARPPRAALDALLARAADGGALDEDEIVRLFEARGEEFDAVCAAADALRQRVNGETVSYVVNRNINYTNVCYFKCGFCAFSKGKLSENLRGRPYDLELSEIARRAEEAWERGATEVCLQGGIHPAYTGETYLEVCRALKRAVPGIHIHAFSPLEIWQGASTLGLAVEEFIARLAAEGLATLPGTAAEILDDEVRRIICPDKINTAQWLSVIEAAHRTGLRTTATIMFGHVDRPVHWARHLLRVRGLQERTGGITEFVPLPFVHMEAPLYLKGRARRGPTYREAVLMHAVARLALHPHITNIQASWVKMGAQGVKACLGAGVNDLGGTLMNESITRAAGGAHGQEMTPERMEALIRSADRLPVQRTTLYERVPEARVRRSFGAPPVAETFNTPARRYERDRARPLVRSETA